MAGKPKPPRLIRWGRDKAWHLFVTDPWTRKQARINCEARGKFNADERKQMLKDATEQWDADMREFFRGGNTRDYKRSLAEALNAYLVEVTRLEKLREEVGGKAGLAPRSAQRIRDSIGPFRDSLPGSMTTGLLTVRHLRLWFDDVATLTSSANANVHRRNIRAALNTINRELFPDSFPNLSALAPAFKQTRVEPREAVAYTPDELRAFYWSLPESHRLTFHFYACTGARTQDLPHAQLVGTVLILPRGKTGRRYLPLTDAPEGEVAPCLLALLKEKWPRKFSRKAWSKCGRITPQLLRSNFTSYAASLGFPPAVVALWQGHGLAVAEKHYRRQVLSRKQADSIEAAMDFLDERDQPPERFRRDL